ncbi:hypothetical protein H257_02709 [Aphanomyces astaci]|uniref:Major facilitator superfamily (MFS) profile domain-containing protein n=1 Tax=Aphanomyces astaci TaxID=112090 RepID=W4H2P0_APHAT|nr:hypothetical protein H257_02709 [Aphanomyces astaci]ETV86290.1 hypothetical protein H257_02709 [Aphanomyces astaci]RQM29907.1 hypothetical protein B5M09_004984 [Aphanomyces astaci]|eukprot:XP_009824762.1 hypothetical protein H257_02709 [Aphanomyces astaci]
MGSEHDACLPKVYFSNNQPITAADTARANRLFAVVGFSYIIALDALLQPVDYWRLLFPTFNAEFEISWVYTGTCVGTLLVLLLQHGTPVLDQRIRRGFMVLLLFMSMLPLSHFVLSTTTQHLVMVLASAAALGASIAAIDSSVFALASLFSSTGQTVEHVQLGLGVALLVSALYRVASKACFESDMVVAASMVYFGVAFGTIAMGLVAFSILVRLPMAQQRLHERAKGQTMNVSIWRKIWPHEAMVALTYLTTFSVYPGVITSIPCFHDESGWWNATGWWPLVLMTSYAVCEPLGRYCVRWRCGFTHKTVWKLVVPRVVLVLLIVCCAEGSLWFTQYDVFSLGVVMALGFTNGFVGTLALVVVNDVVDDHERTFTGMCATLTINTGIFVGTTVGLALASWLNL